MGRTRAPMLVMSAREHSLTASLLIYKYVFGTAFIGSGILLFRTAHPLISGPMGIILCVLGCFFLSVARVKLEHSEVRYRRFFRWYSISYSEIRECGENWVFGYIRPHHYAVPWGSIYFARPDSSDSLFSFDREIIDAIRAKSRI